MKLVFTLIAAALLVTSCASKSDDNGKVQQQGGNCGPALVAQPNQVQGCTVELVYPTNCAVVDLRNGNQVQFKFRYQGDQCGTLLGRVSNGQVYGEKQFQVPPTDGRWNDVETPFSEANLNGIDSASGVYHWMVISDQTGSHPTSQGFKVLR